jgi:multicomponent Na+:H+ antiporter subunit D
MLIVLPILIPLITAAFCLLLWRFPIIQKYVSLCGVFSLMLISMNLISQVNETGICVTQIGNWSAPYGITLVADRLSALMILITAVTSLCVMLYSLGSLDSRRVAFGFHPIVNIMLMGVCGSFLTGDIFNLFVWFEVILMSSFVLLALGGERAQLEGSIKYVALNLLASILFLSGVALLYGLIGTLNMADLAVRIRSGVSETHTVMLSMLFLVSFGVKAAIFPFFSWLPASYHTPPIAITAIFASILTKVGLYALIRVFTLIFINNTNYTHGLFLLLAGLTMITGVLGAYAQKDIRRTLAFYSISQIGFMLMGLGLFTPLAFAGTMFFFIHHAVVKTNMFLLAGEIHYLKGTYDLKKLGNLLNEHAWLALAFLISLVSSFGLPPLSGFFSKFVLVSESLKSGAYGITSVAIIASFLSLLPLFKLWSEIFLKRRTMEHEVHDVNTRRLHGIFNTIPIIALTSLTLLIGLFAQPILFYLEKAGHDLYNPSEYINAVLEGEMK